MNKHDCVPIRFYLDFICGLSISCFCFCFIGGFGTKLRASILPLSYSPACPVIFYVRKYDVFHLPFYALPLKASFSSIKHLLAEVLREQVIDIS